MPRMDGYQLVEAGLARDPNLKLLLMTATAHRPPAEFLGDADTEILHKPFDSEILALRAWHLIGLGRSRGN